jgi:hypothetical protein
MHRERANENIRSRSQNVVHALPPFPNLPFTDEKKMYTIFYPALLAILPLVTSSITTIGLSQHDGWKTSQMENTILFQWLKPTKGDSHEV